ncbi:MAG: M42 family metallopeptidase [Peptostreptococcaceae bacterium]
MKFDLNNTINVMKKYLDIPSPAGYTDIAVLECQKDFESLGLECNITNKGALIARLPGEDNTNQITISAHMDTLGAMVKEITPDGKIKYHKIGGGCWAAVEGENCTVITRKNGEIRGTVTFKYSSTHTYGQVLAGSERTGDNMIIRLDEDVICKQDVLDLGINVGDFIYMDTRFEYTKSGFIKTRYIDNKAAVAIVLELARYFKENNIKPARTTNFFISTYEEVGHGPSKSIPCQTTEFVSIDVAPVGDGQTSSEHSVCITAKDKLTVYDSYLRFKLTDIAEENEVLHNIDVFNNYGSDASQAILWGEDFRFANVGPGIDTSHHYERTHIDAIDNTLKLLGYYILSK